MPPAITWRAHFICCPVHGGFVSVIFLHFHIPGGWRVPLAESVVPLRMFEFEFFVKVFAALVA